MFRFLVITEIPVYTDGHVSCFGNLEYLQFPFLYYNCFPHLKNKPPNKDLIIKQSHLSL